MFIFIVGGGLYLLMEHPFIFWLVALPLFLLIVGSIINWIRKEKNETVVKRWILPILAIMGCVFMIFCAIMGHGVFLYQKAFR